MLDSNIRGLFKKIEYQIANLKGLFSKNEKQMLDNINDFKKDNEEFKDSQKYVLTVHIDDQNNPHKVTKNQIGLDKVDNVKQASEVEFLAHKNNTELHVTAEKQKYWDAKETTSGSQSKADAALATSKKHLDAHVNNKNNPHAVTKAQVGLSNVDNIKQASKVDFDNHVGDKILHTSEAERNKWNNGQLYPLTPNNGEIKRVPNGSDLFTLPTGYYVGAKLLNLPVDGDVNFYYISVFNTEMVDGYRYKCIIATRSFDNTTWIGTFHYQGFRGWKRLIDDTDFQNVQWLNVTLKNGASTGDRPFQFARFGGLLLLRGHITANREVVIGELPEGAPKPPKQGAVESASVSGTTGFSKLFLNSNGEFTLTGLFAKNESAVTGYYMDMIIPLD
ncbi:MAG: hypothetical protein ACQEWR_09025 [Bacillota bacterium]